MSAIKRIKNELQELGYDPVVYDTPKGQAVFIEYLIQAGVLHGKKILIGFSFQEDGYPEYPPHWIHISPPYNDHLGGSQDRYSIKDRNGICRECLAISRPPSDLWDRLPTKHMKNYLGLHIAKFCVGLR